MNSPPLDLPPRQGELALTYIGREAVELLSILLADTLTDIEVAARDAGISDASFVRQRRATDRVACVQSVLETMKVERVGASDDEGALRMRMRVRGAVDLLTRGWPEDYPAGAVEWLLLQLSPR
ncbi:hypothetical protein A6V36_02990 [Paraburkholderia ginsengiterrae]|uniref:Uncharacterized protein n=2 Tax=Paraburkholderia ginsengiterrae TaxID=1462993 RepID=A0A1A9NCS7_9BURK|nr:hypothetical protein A6V36_02990 [Paraburkholderia ginsengiterrae]OAJ64327.1 hypothetical protein A6V37_02190 [Paraburkholderia ginsengiterrae]